MKHPNLEPVFGNCFICGIFTHIPPGYSISRMKGDVLVFCSKEHAGAYVKAKKFNESSS